MGVGVRQAEGQKEFRTEEFRKEEYQEEKAYLQEVIAFAEKRMEELQDKKALLQQEILEQTEVMREVLTTIIRDFDDIIQLSMENAVLTRAQQQYADNEKEHRRLERLKESPYFARIDFVDQEFGEENRVYIGASGLSDAKSYQMYICDWRAPVCELFYGFDTGEAWYETARGKVEVMLSKKRQFKISGGQLQGMYDSESALYDDILGTVLSGHTGSRLKVIVESIQKEQNRAIRFTKNPHVLIYGPAGSGKTSVGMHRLAYILYEQKDRLKATDIVILSNNQAFASYIAGILPELCEEEAGHMIFQELLDSLLPGEVTSEDFYGQYRAVEGADNGTEEAKQRRARIAFKYSEEMLQLIERYFREYAFEIPDMMYEDEVILSSEELQGRMRRRALDQQGKGITETYRQRLEFLIATVKKVYENYFLDHREQICQQMAEMELDEDGDKLDAKALKLRYKMRRRETIVNAVETIRNRNEKSTLTHLLEILDYAEQTNGKEHGIDSNRQFYPQKSGETMAELVWKDWKEDRLCFEDALLYVITGLYTGEIQPFQNVLHVLIDELQDYSPLQLYLVRLLYPHSAFTMLADSSQAVSSVMSLQRIAEIEEIWGMVSDDPMEKLALRKSYRSSAPINELAFGWLQQFDPVCAESYTYFHREGKAPVMITTDQPQAEVQKLLAQLAHCNLVGIITADEEDARALYESCGESDLQLLTEPQQEMCSKKVILPLILSKGLEFDAVILYRFRDRLISSDSYARKMYLGCTRALHELYLVEC